MPAVLVSLLILCPFVPFVPFCALFVPVPPPRLTQVLAGHPPVADPHKVPRRWTFGVLFRLSLPVICSKSKTTNSHVIAQDGQRTALLWHLLQTTNKLSSTSRWAIMSPYDGITGKYWSSGFLHYFNTYLSSHSIVTILRRFSLDVVLGGY